MSYSFSVNNTPATGAVTMYLLVATLTAAGWTQANGSDGTTMAASQVTSGASGAGGLGNNNAWVRMRAPGVNGGTIADQHREITIQRGLADTSWRIKYSASAGFTGGSPSATQTPSAADEVIVLGAGTDASPTYNTWLPTNGTYRSHVACGGAAEFYSFVTWQLPTGGTSTKGALFLDVMATGSFSSLDVDPAVIYVSQAATPGVFTEISSSGGTLTTVANPSLARAWLGATSAAGAATNTNNVNVNMLQYGAAQYGGAGSMGSNPFSTKDDMLPVPYWRPGSSTAPVGWKGFSTLFLWPSVPRTTMDTYDVLGTKDRIYVNTVTLPWSGASPLI